ncbi:MAG: tetratricopeptide repeat protein [Chitinispirillaceae bacterium]|nr:tetratricopeptide repeat protein [Chitinispirillaceae bacterium]
MKKTARSLICILLLLPPGIHASRLSTAVFPLTNESGSALHDWIGYGISETLARKLQQMERFQVWDPVFLFQTDSSGREMLDENLLKMHRTRWQWDAAMGGSYRLRGDTLAATFRLVWATGKEEPLSVSLQLSGRVVDFFSLTGEALLKMFHLMQYRPSPADSQIIRERASCAMDAYRTYAAGFGYEMRGDYHAALTAYLRATEIDARFAAASCREAMLYRTAAEYTKAKEAFERAFAADPNDPAIAAGYADFLVDCLPPAIAFKFIGSQRALLGKSAAGMKAMGKMYIVSGEYPRAIAMLTRAVAFGPSDLDVAFALGTAYSTAGDFTRAAEIFNQLIQYRPYHVRYYASLGGAYRKAGRLMESTIVLESAEKITPDNTMVLVDLAHTYIRLGWYEKAGQLLLRAREIAPFVSDIGTNLGVVYWYQGKKAEARKCFEEAARAPTTRQAAFNNLGNVLFMDGSPGKAIAAYKKADQAGRKNETVLYNLAAASLARNDRKKAAVYFDEVLRLMPDRLDVLLRQAEIAASLKRSAAAEGYYRRIIELLPDHEAALRGLVRILMRQKRYREAVQPIEEYLSRQPMSREFMLLLADVYVKMAWREVALMKYQAVAREFPDDSSAHLGIGTCMYALIAEKGMTNYDDAILALKKASDHAAGNPLPDQLIGDLYAVYKGYRELAIDHWKKALARAVDPKTRKLLQQRLGGKG